MSCIHRFGGMSRLRVAIYTRRQLLVYYTSQFRQTMIRLEWNPVSMHVYVCMHVCMYVYIYIYIHTYIYIPQFRQRMIRQRMEPRKYACICMYMYVCIHIYSTIPSNQ